MRPPMLHTAYKVTKTRNAYGDLIAAGETAHQCHFKYNTQQVTDTNSEQVQSDALAWFRPDSGIERMDILKIYGEHWLVEKVIKARRLRDPDVQFIKVELMKYGAIS